MYVERSIDIAAPPEVVWAVLADVERWHEWTASIESVQRLDAGPFGLGSRALVRQPRLRPATFEVTEFNPGRNFVWTTRSGGLDAVADHRVEAVPGGTRATISLRFTGALLLVFGWWVRRLTERYFTMESEGLKRRSEQP
ncbi:MAG: SRPBCC family protein [Dehalococcoidia bacterium]|nr:SRPBCC family protein [Dehalococcoidia bacterium]